MTSRISQFPSSGITKKKQIELKVEMYELIDRIESRCITTASVMGVAGIGITVVIRQHFQYGLYTYIPSCEHEYCGEWHCRRFR